MKARKTKSGRYNVKVVDHYEYRDGKRYIRFRSFTADTKAECEALAADFLYQKAEMTGDNITVEAAIRRYIDSRVNICTPYTLRRYNGLARWAYGDLNRRRVLSLRSDDLQRWMNDYKRNHAPASCQSAYGLLIASVKTIRPGAAFHVTMPRAKQREYYTPTDADVKTLLDYLKGTELEKAVLLSALGTLRRGEVCAVTYDDIHGDEISVNKSMVRVGGKWVFRSTKTPQSVRSVKYPQWVIDRLQADVAESGRVVNLTPKTITTNFQKARDACGLPRFRFHDLRAYAVSIRHALGVPDVYIMQDGGYKSDAVMKQVYRRTMDDKRKEYAARTTAHFNEVFGEK